MDNGATYESRTRDYCMASSHFTTKLMLHMYDSLGLKSRRTLSNFDFGTASRTWTCDIWINSPLFYRLNYGGIYTRHILDCKIGIEPITFSWKENVLPLDYLQSKYLLNVSLCNPLTSLFIYLLLYQPLCSIPSTIFTEATGCDVGSSLVGIRALWADILNM